MDTAPSLKNLNQYSTDKLKELVHIAITNQLKELKNVKHEQQGEK